MSNPKKTHKLILQNEKIVKKSQKHDVNLQKNSTLYFQIGLIVCLLAAYGLFEMKLETNIPQVAKVIPLDEPYSINIPVIKEEKPVAKEPVKQKQSKKSNDFIEVPDDTPDNPFKDEPKDPIINSTPDINPNFDGLIDEPEDESPIPYAFIQQVPIYPGCENKKSNDAKRKCMSDKITKLVQRKFDTELAGELGLTGKQVIRTEFKIDKTGHVIDIKARATHPKLKEEAERVINKIPEMIPGKQNDKNVGVIYNLPIVFQVHN